MSCENVGNMKAPEEGMSGVRCVFGASSDRRPARAPRCLPGGASATAADDVLSRNSEVVARQQGEQLEVLRSISRLLEDSQTLQQ